MPVDQHVALRCQGDCCRAQAEGLQSKHCPIRLKDVAGDSRSELQKRAVGPAGEEREPTCGAVSVRKEIDEPNPPSGLGQWRNGKLHTMVAS